MTLYLDDDDVSRLLPMDDAIDCVDKAFRLLADAAATNVVRQRSTWSGGSLNVMWAIAPTEGYLGVKEYPVVRSDVTKGAVLILLLHSIETGELLAVMRADRLGQLRTGAASAVATRALANPDARTLSVYGTGFQAETQVPAIAAVLPQLTTIRVVSRNPERRDQFVDRVRDLLGVTVVPADPREAAEAADVIVTATGSVEPVFDGEWVSDGTHINAVGSNVATKREIDRRLLERASRIVVDDREVAAVECGDLIANDWDQADVVALAEVLTGSALGRRHRSDITLFESQGLAVEDVVCAGVVYERARAQGIGRKLS